MRTNKWNCMLALCGALVLSAPRAARSAALPYYGESLDGGSLADDAREDAHEDQLYSQATQAINEGRWSDAEQLLDQVFGLHGRRSDAAVYWKAYVKSKEGRPSDALEACATLRQGYPQSNWLKDCSALEIEIRGKSGSPVQPQAEQDEELKLLALSSLMQGGNSNSLPILQQILEGQSSERLKERALFVLAQNQSKQAQELLGQIVRGEKDPHLQIKAIHLLAAAQGSNSTAILGAIYDKSNDPSVKKAVLDTYLIINDPEKLVQIATHESDPQLAHHAVSELGAMGAVSRLSEIYSATSSKELKSSILNAYVAAGGKGADALGAIASSEQDPELRRKAIRNMGASGGSSAIPALLAIYSKSSDEESKKAATDALFVAGDAHDLVALARTEKDPAARRNIVGKLAVMHSKEATDYLMELLNK
ncbi:MAG: HEAT repeat domain-containing protein [Terracidiphilus sp.]